MIVNKYKIREICQLNKNSYSKKDKWRFFNYLDTKNIVQNEIDNIEFLDSSIDKIPSRAKRKVDNEDIIISTVRPNQKHYGIIRNQPLNFLVSTAFTTLSVNKNIAMPLYVYYYITQNYIIEFLQTIAEQATTSYPSIKTSDIGNLDISLPDLEYQNKVISILNNLDSKINFNKKLNHNLEKMAEIIFNKYFENNDNTKKNLKLLHSENWKKIKLGEIISISSGKRPKQKVDMQNKEFKYPLYGASSIMGYVNEFLYNEEILIIGRVGTHGIVQRVKDASFPSDNTLIIKSKYYNFVYQILKRIDYDSLNTGSTQPLLTQKSIKNVEIVLPSLKLVNKYENYCRNLFNKIDINNKEIEKLTQLRDTLLPKLMSGEIDLSEIEV